MKTVFNSNAPCPFCGRPMYRPTQQRFIDPVCQECRPERLAQAERENPDSKPKVIVFSENIKACI